MTSRELRKERREAERKAKKIAYQQSRAAAISAAETCGAGSSAGEPVARPAYTPCNHPSALPPNPDLFDEFSAEEQLEMMSIRARLHARAAESAPAPTPCGAGSLAGKPVAGPASTERLPSLKSGPNGPTSPEGKAISSANSLKHGLASGRVIIPGEDPADFEALLADLLAEHAPATETESLLVQQMAQSWWLLQRAIRIQNQAFTETRVDTHKLALFMRYQTTDERAFYRALNSLMKLQKERRKTVQEFVSQKRRANPPQPEFVSQKSAPKASVSASSEPKAAFARPPHGRAA